MKRIVVLPALLLAAFLAGCSGGGSNSQPATGSGKATLTVDWPERSTRYIPSTSESIQVMIQKGDGTQVTSTVLDRPAVGNQTQATFNDLPVGTLTVTASAHPQPGAQGTAQSTGTAPLVINNGLTSQVTLTMQSTITRFSISPDIPVMNPGDTLSLVATARDAADRIVLVDPTKIVWSSQNGTVASVTLGGQLTANTPGATIITVRDTESGASQDITVNVRGILITPRTASVAPGGTQQFTATDGITGAPVPVTWNVTGGNVNGRIGTTTGLYTAPNTPGTYQIAATRSDDPTQRATAVVTVQ